MLDKLQGLVSEDMLNDGAEFVLWALENPRSIKMLMICVIAVVCSFVIIKFTVKHIIWHNRINNYIAGGSNEEVLEEEKERGSSAEV